MRLGWILVVFFVATPGVAACAAGPPQVTLDIPDATACRHAAPVCLPYPEGRMTDHDVIVTVRFAVEPRCTIEDPVPVSDIVVEFDPLDMGPEWLGIDIVPERLVFPARMFWHPDNVGSAGTDVYVEDAQRARIELWHRGRVDDTAADDLRASDGLVPMHLIGRVPSAQDGAVGWRESFGVTLFQVDARSALPPIAHEVPLEETTPVGIGFVVAPLFAALLRRR